jgi:Rieske Fe-S protein
MDYMAFIGKNSGNDNRYIITGDSGNGLTHGVLAGKIIADEILGNENPWADLYNPKRKATLAKSLPSILGHDLQINSQYKRFLQSDIEDVGQLTNGKGGVLNATGKKPIAVYKDEEGTLHRRSALCPHMGGVVCWNDGEKSWDCPVHGSRFAWSGEQVMGPAVAGLKQED